MNKGFLSPAIFIKRRFGSFALCAVFFGLGVLAGHFSSLSTPDTLLLDLQEKIGFCRYFFSGSYSFSFSDILFSLTPFLFPFLCFLSAFFPFGYIPVLFISAVRGFFLCFSVSSLVGSLGRGAWPFCALAAGLPETIRLPAFLLFAASCFECSLSLTRQNARETIVFHRCGRSLNLFFSLLICFGAFAAASAVQIIILPAIASLLAML